MSEIDFMGYKCSFHVDSDKKIHYEHNIRLPELVQLEKDHIDPTKFSEVTLNLGKLQEAYETVFGDAIREYNKGKRKDRQISNYLEQIKKDGRRGKHLNQKADGARKPAYEAIIQIGCTGNQPEPEKAFKVLKLFVEKWIPSHYPNIKPILIAYHGDEFCIDRKTKKKIPSGFHCHFDFIYTAHCLSEKELKEELKYRAEMKEKKKKELETRNISFDDDLWKQKDWREDMICRTGKSLTKGPALQASLSSALLEMGFKTGNGTTAQIQFEEQVRHDLQDFAESMGLKIDRTPGERHKHDKKSVYQEKQELKKEKEYICSEVLKSQKQIEQLKKDRAYVDEQKKENLQNADNNAKKEAELFEQERELNKRIDFIKQKSELAQSFECIAEEVEKNQQSFDKIESDFWEKENTIPLKQRISDFVNECKKIVTNVAVQLSKYKQAFERCWKWSPKNFRNLAEQMEEEGCTNYEQFVEKRRFGVTKSQIKENKTTIFKGRKK